MDFIIEEPMGLQSAFQSAKINIKMQFTLLKMIYAFYKSIIVLHFSPSYL